MPRTHVPLWVCIWSFFLVNAIGQTKVLTNPNHQSRTAANLNETILTPANVNTNTFGKLGTYTVDGAIFAQPLYAQGLTIHGATHNVLFVCVMYAFDADTVGSIPLWTLDFRPSTVAPNPIHTGSTPSSGLPDGPPVDTGSIGVINQVSLAGGQTRAAANSLFPLLDIEGYLVSKESRACADPCGPLYSGNSPQNTLPLWTAESALSIA